MTRIFAPGRVRNWLFALTTSFIAAYIISFIFSLATCSFAAIDWKRLDVDTSMCAQGPGGFYLGGIIATTCKSPIFMSLLENSPLMTHD